MDRKFINLLCDPIYRDQLKLENINGNDCLVTRDKMLYPIVDGISKIFYEDDIDGLNERYMNFYNKFGGWINKFENFTSKFNGVDNTRRIWTNDICIKPGYRVLEVAIGTGWNIKVLPLECEYFGIDISWTMLKQCEKNLQKWGRKAELFQGLAEELPFKNEIFDVVYHIGGINSFNDKASAIREMARVAKKGGTIVIIDENEGHKGCFYENIPILNKAYLKVGQDVQVLPSFPDVPSDMNELEVKYINNNSMYQVRFTKPR